MQTLVEIKKQLEAVQKSFDRNHSLLIEFDKEFHKSCKILASRPCKPFSYDFFLPYQNPDFKKGTLAAINHYINAYINYFSVITRFFTEIYFPLKKELDQINEVIESMEIAVKKFDQVAFTRSDEVFFEPKRAANVISTQINNFKETRDLLSSQFSGLIQLLMAHIIDEYDIYTEEVKNKSYHSRIYMRLDKSYETFDVNNLIKFSRELIQKYLNEKIDEYLKEIPNLDTKMLTDDDRKYIADDLAYKLDAEQTNKENLRLNC